MTPLAAESRTPTEKPTVYRGPAALIGGALVVLFCGFGSVDLMIESGAEDLIGAAILALIAVLAWLFGVYPAAFSWTDRLVVRNPFRTIALPWETVTELSARLSFIARTETKRYTVWAIPVSLRDRRRSERMRFKEVAQAQRAAKRGVSPELIQPGRGQRPHDPIERFSFADQAIAEMNARREAQVVKARLSAKYANAGGSESTPAAETAPVLSGTVRWSWLSVGLFAGSVVFLIVALSVR
jgi:hypothetical protein